MLGEVPDGGLSTEGLARSGGIEPSVGIVAGRAPRGAERGAPGAVLRSSRPFNRALRPGKHGQRMARVIATAEKPLAVPTSRTVNGRRPPARWRVSPWRISPCSPPSPPPLRTLEARSYQSPDTPSGFNSAIFFRNGVTPAPSGISLAASNPPSRETIYTSVKRRAGPSSGGRQVAAGDAAAIVATLETPPDRVALRRRAAESSVGPIAYQYLELLLTGSHPG